MTFIFSVDFNKSRCPEITKQPFPPIRYLKLQLEYIRLNISG